MTIRLLCSRRRCASLVLSLSFCAGVFVLSFHPKTTTMTAISRCQSTEQPVPVPRYSRYMTLQLQSNPTVTAHHSDSVHQRWARPRGDDSASRSNSVWNNRPPRNVTQSKDSNSGNPFQMSKLKFQKKMQEMELKDRAGEELSQAYCDHVLGLCVSSDEWESVLEVLDVMNRQGLGQERSTYRACLQACFESGNGASAKEILVAMEKALVEAEPYDIGLTIAAMCRNNMAESGWWRKALGLLKSSTTTPNSVVSQENPIPVQAYNAIIECMVEEGQWKEAIRLLRTMEESNQQIQGQPQPQGFHPAPGVSTYREVIECCVGSKQAEQAVQILYNMKDRGVAPTTYAFELVIAALSRKMQWRRAVQLLALMEEMNVPKTVVTYNSVISSCARSREVGMAKNLLSKMRKEGIRPNEVSFNSVIGACASTARWKDALALLDQCYREPGVTPNIYIYTNAMRACARGGNTNRALNLLQVVKDKGLPVDVYCYTACIDACAKAKQWKKALSLLDEMQEQGIEPSEVTYSVAISACGNGGQWQKALSLLEVMRAKDMPINLITYNAAITAISKASRQNAKIRAKQQNGGITEVKEDLWSRALLLLGQMKEDGIDPDGFCYSSAISCCGAEGRWEEALNLLNVMKRGGPKTRPNKIAYTAAISACGQAGEAERALELFQNMKDEGLSADRIAYNALFYALRVVGNAESSFKLWQEICGTRKTSTSAIATAKDVASPDIVTVTECLATLSRAGHVEEMDMVFEGAVERGIVLSGKLDSRWEMDLSGMSFPVARGSVRYILNHCSDDDDPRQHLTFITGIGRSHKQNSKGSSGKVDDDGKDPRTTLRDYVQEVLRTEFEPSIQSSVPPRAQGTVEVDMESWRKWKTGN